MSEITTNNVTNDAILQLLGGYSSTSAESIEQATSSTNASATGISTSLANVIAKFFEGLRLGEVSEADGTETTQTTEVVKKKKKSFWGKLKSAFKKITKTITKFVSSITSKATSLMDKAFLPIKSAAKTAQEVIGKVTDTIDSVKGAINTVSSLKSLLPALALIFG